MRYHAAVMMRDTLLFRAALDVSDRDLPDVVADRARSALVAQATLNGSVAPPAAVVDGFARAYADAACARSGPVSLWSPDGANVTTFDGREMAAMPPHLCVCLIDGHPENPVG